MSGKAALSITEKYEQL